MAAPKIIPYQVKLRSTTIERSLVRPIVYTNDLRSAEFQFQVTDMQAGELSGATATTLLYMKDGSFFQNPKEDVELTGTTFSYLLKEDEGNHAGIARIQLVVRFNEGLEDEQNFPSQLYDFEIVNGLETQVAQQIMIHDWTTLTREARAYIDEFAANEILREAEFDNAQVDRTAAFNVAQTERTNQFNELAGELSATLEAADANIAEFDIALQNGIIGENIAAELQNLEETYAPELLSVKQQLEQTATEVETVKINVATLTNQKADVDYVNQKVQAANLAYKESYLTLTELQNKYPAGDNYNHVVLSDGMIYTYANSTWTNTNIQANGTGIAPNSIDAGKVTFLSGLNLFKGDYSHLFLFNGALTESPSVVSVVVDASELRTYQIQTYGDHNRFIVYAATARTVGSTAIELHKQSSNIQNCFAEVVVPQGYSVLIIALSFDTQQQVEILVTETESKIAGTKVLTDKNKVIRSRHIDDKSIEEKHVGFISGLNLFDNKFTTVYANSVSGILEQSTIVTTALFEMENGKTYFIHAEGYHNRFNVALTNSLTVGTQAKKVFTKNLDSNYQQHYIEVKNNENYKYMLIALSNTSQKPSVYIYSEDGFVIANRKIKVDSLNAKDPIGTVFETKKGNPRQWIDATKIPESIGVRVPRLVDQANLNIVYTNYTSDSQPTVTEFNSRKVLKFEADRNTILNSTDLSLTNAKDCITIFSVFNYEFGKGSGSRPIFYNSTPSNAIYTGIALGVSSHRLTSFCRNLHTDTLKHALVNNGQNPYDSNFILMRSVFDFANGLVKTYINGALRKTNTITAGKTPASNALASSIGGTGTIDQHFDGYLGELIVYDFDIAEYEANSIEKELSEKWGIPLYVNEKKLRYSTKYKREINFNGGKNNLILLTTNQKNKRGEQIETMGYLWSDQSEMGGIYYSPTLDDEPTKLFDWTETYKATRYKFVICSNGDVVAVLRGDFAASARNNPLIFKKSASYARSEIALPIRPTAWFQNSGMNYKQGNSIDEDYFVFAEYTRPIHDVGYVWKVTYPFENPSNWRKIMEVTAGDDAYADSEIEHFHTANYDPYGDCWLVTSGDEDQQVNVWMSTDGAETFTRIGGGSQSDRVINYVFLKDEIYWASDWSDHTHGLYKMVRDENERPSFSTKQRVRALPVGQSTYHTIYDYSSNGLLLLDYAESREDHLLDVYYYDIRKDELRLLDIVNASSAGEATNIFGFRASASSHYVNKHDGKAVLSYEDPVPNRTTILGNVENDVRTVIIDLLI
ncbi:hypothetical protein [Jeotgalibaca porci]|uniref:hypothetical protein n=1 Tax=Jeotgalibaca porci TaxID=1868793 RepID=UPI0035A00EA9